MSTSERKPDGTVIKTEVSKRNGEEVTTTTTIFPDGRRETHTHTRGGNQGAGKRIISIIFMGLSVDPLTVPMHQL